MGRWLALTVAIPVVLGGCGLPASSPAASHAAQANRLDTSAPAPIPATFRAHSLFFPSTSCVTGAQVPDVTLAVSHLGLPLGAAGLPEGGLAGNGLLVGGSGSFGSCGPFAGGYGGLRYGITGYGGLGYNLPTVGIGLGIGTTVGQLPVSPQPSPPQPSPSPSPSAQTNDQSQATSKGT